MPSQTPHRTPLKRVSQGSLLRLSRSGAYPDAPYGLGFLEPALAEFVDETEALQTNVEGLANLSESLATFNESFASWLYIMNMNALTTDWPQVCFASSIATCLLKATLRHQHQILLHLRNGEQVNSNRSDKSPKGLMTLQRRKQLLRLKHLKSRQRRPPLQLPNSLQTKRP